MYTDAKSFHEQLDSYYAGHDNEATEKFLLDTLEELENAMMISSGCGCCADGDCEDEGATEEELKWMIGLSEAKITVLNELACFYRGISRWDECLGAFSRVKEEIELCGLTGDDSYALVTLNLAGAYRLLGRFEDALAAFEEAKAILDKNGKLDAYSYSSYYNNAGLVYQDMKDYTKAVEFFEKALQLMPRTPENLAEIATGLSNLAMSHYASGDPQSAEMKLDEAIEIFKKLDEGKKPHYAGALNTKAFFCFNAGNIEKSAELFEEAIELTKLIFGENNEYAISCRNCSFAYRKLGNTEKADMYAAIAERILGKP